LKAIRREVGDPKIAAHRGRIVKTTGDGLLVEFASVVDAVRCAVEMQREMIARNAATPAGRRIEFRMGINVGDIIIEDGDIFGDGVNIAARLEALAESGGICLSAAAHEQVRDRLDIAFDDLGEQQVKNITRPVRTYRVALGASSHAPLPAAAPLQLPDKPSLAVLPFQNLTGDAEQEYFVDGMVEEITTAIARLPGLFVIARTSAFTYKGKPVDIKQIGRELGVRYILEGSVRKADNRVRISGQLVDTTTGAHIWADRFDSALGDIFELQDRVSSAVVAAIEPKLLHTEIERAFRKPTDSLDAYDLYLRASAECDKLTEAGMQEAVTLLRRALTIDPAYAPAAAFIGICRCLQRTHGWVNPEGNEISEAIALARQAIESSSDDADALRMASYTLALLGGEREMGLRGIERSLTLNPNSAHAWLCKGLVCCFLNRPDPAQHAFEYAARLSPVDPLGYLFLWGLALAHFLAGRYEASLELAEQSSRDHPRYIPPLRLKVALYVHFGRIDEARRTLYRMLELFPAITIVNLKAQMPWLMPLEAGKLLLDGFRKLGVAES
jgi:adenylate cyclase